MKPAETNEMLPTRGREGLLPRFRAIGPRHGTDERGDDEQRSGVDFPVGGRKNPGRSPNRDSDWLHSRPADGKHMLTPNERLSRYLIKVFGGAVQSSPLAAADLVVK